MAGKNQQKDGKGSKVEKRGKVGSVKNKKSMYSLNLKQGLQFSDRRIHTFLKVNVSQINRIRATSAVENSILHFKKNQLEIKEKKSNKNQPIIGILTMPANLHQHNYTYPNYQYVLESNILFIEQYGAKAVPIRFDGSEEYIKKMMTQVNGIYFTGGYIDINYDRPLIGSKSDKNIYTINAKLIMDIAIKLNDSGIFFGIWGICQGFQLMQYIISGLNNDVLEDIDNDINVSRSAIFSQTSKLFQNAPNNIFQYAIDQQPLFYWHEYCVTDKSYQKYQKLKQFFKQVGWSYNSQYKDQRNTHYIAAIEAYDYPFYATQFHPEITQFSDNFNTDKHKQAIKISQYLGQILSGIASNNCQQQKDRDQRIYKMMFNNFKKIKFDDYQFGSLYLFKESDFDNNQIIN